MAMDIFYIKRWKDMFVIADILIKKKLQCDAMNYSLYPNVTYKSFHWYINCFKVKGR